MSLDEEIGWRSPSWRRQEGQRVGGLAILDSLELVGG